MARASPQLSRLRGFGGGAPSLHVVLNNQVAFTTDVVDMRSSRYATDVLRPLMPVLHVNGDDGAVP